MKRFTLCTEVLLEMKITNAIMLLLAIFLLLAAPLSQQVSNFDKMTEQHTSYNNALDSAIDYALESIVESADGTQVEINFDECISNFYEGMYAAFGASNSETAQTRLRVCVPILAIVDVDGLYVYHSNLNNNQVVSNWSEKIPFVYTAPSYTITFSLDNTVKFKVAGDSTVYTGDYRYLKEQYASEVSGDKYDRMSKIFDSSCLKSAEDFESTRDLTVTNTIVDNLNYYVQKHNRIGQSYGYNYTFALPSSAKTDVARAIGDVSFISFFQGYPYGIGTSDSFSKFTVSGARIEKKKKFYLNKVDDFLYYHTEDCVYSKGSSHVYDSKKECALEGANPCPYCKP